MICRYQWKGNPWPTGVGSALRPTRHFLRAHGVTISDPPTPEPEQRLLQLWDGDCDVPNILLAVRSAVDLRPDDVVEGRTVLADTYITSNGWRVWFTDGSYADYPPGVPVVLDKQADR